MQLQVMYTETCTVNEKGFYNEDTFMFGRQDVCILECRHLYRYMHLSKILTVGNNSKIRKFRYVLYPAIIFIDFNRGRLFL